MELDEDAPEVPILLLGDQGIGKTAFLSRISLAGRPLAKGQPLPMLRDLDQPFPFNVRFHRRQLRMEFYDTASPESYVLLKPKVIVLCFGIDQPSSLQSVQTTWKNLVESTYNYDESIPVILLGLKRDVRQRSDYDGKYTPLNDGINGSRRTFVYPQEALRVAQEMRLDRFCECSALTGELCGAVIEDISKTAAMTLEKEGGRSIGTQCTIL